MRGVKAPLKKDMKTFKVEGWYRHNDEKDFITFSTISDTPENAIKIFKNNYNLHFYKIEIKEIV